MAVADPACNLADRRLRFDAELAERATGIPDADDIVAARSTPAPGSPADRPGCAPRR